MLDSKMNYIRMLEVLSCLEILVFCDLNNTDIIFYEKLSYWNFKYFIENWTDYI